MKTYVTLDKNNMVASAVVSSAPVKGADLALEGHQDVGGLAYSRAEEEFFTKQYDREGRVIKTLLGEAKEDTSGKRVRGLRIKRLANRK